MATKTFALTRGLKNFLADYGLAFTYLERRFEG
jgi:hypothetical protein